MAHGFDCDVLVVGGGPAGSTAASWLARERRRVILFERDEFPRFHIGESLLASVNDVLDAIGADEQIRARRLSRRSGARRSCRPTAASSATPISRRRPTCARRRRGRCRARRSIDLLLRHAAASGADVREAPSRARRRIRRRRRHGRRCRRTPEPRRRRSRARARARRRVRARRRCCRASSACASTSRAWPTSPSSRTTPACRAPEGRRAGDIRIVARARSRVVLADSDLRRADERRRRAAAARRSRRSHGIEPDGAARRDDCRHAGGGAAARARAARVAGARREGFLVRLARVCRRSLAARGRRRIVSRSGVLDRRRDRARVGARGGAGGRARPAARRSVRARVPPLLAPPARSATGRSAASSLGFYTPEFRDLFFAEDPPRADVPRRSSPSSPATGGRRWSHDCGSRRSSSSSACSDSSASRRRRPGAFRRRRTRAVSQSTDS